jgi:flagellar FliL protein
MSAPAAAPSASPAGKKRGKLPLIIVAVVCVAAGAALPMFVPIPGMGAKPAEAKPKKPANYATVPVGDLVVNLAEDRMNRYLRMKLSVKVEAEEEKKVTDLVTKHKAAMKSKLISYLAGKTLKDVSGSVGVNKLQREILEKFDDILYPDGESKVKEVLFEEYVVQ